MVTVPRIAAASYLDALPFLYGIGHEGNFRASLSLSDPDSCIKRFSEGLADIALVPAAAVPSLADAHPVTGYCIAASGASGSVLLSCNGPAEEIRRVFLGGCDGTAARLAAFLLQRRWKTAPEYFEAKEPGKGGELLPGDARLLTGEEAFAAESDLPGTYDLTAEWKRAVRLPFVFALWVARGDVDPDWIEGLQYALTFGLEHTYEAVLEYGYDQKPYDAYGRLTRGVDYIFDSQKQKALQKFWDSGLKISPRANPG